MEPKTSKRIVSKSAYVFRRLLRVIGKGAGIVVQVGAVIWVFVAPFQFFEHVDALRHYSNATPFFVAVMLMAVTVGVGMMMIRIVGTKVVQHSDKIDAGVPLTRANTASLPDLDSLVRASSEPEQEQQAVLLRAASEGVERHEEQLVRAVEGQNSDKY